MSDMDTITPAPAPEATAAAPTSDEPHWLPGRLTRKEREVLREVGLEGKSVTEAAQIIADALAAQKERDALKAEAMTEAQRFAAERDEARAEAAAARAELGATKRTQTASQVALNVAKELGVAPDIALEFAGRLVGDDAEAIEADARSVFAKLPKAQVVAPAAADDSATAPDDPDLASFAKGLGVI